MRARHGKPPIPQRSALDSGFAGLGDPFVMVDHLGDDEGEELLRELGIEVGFLGEPPQSGDLPGLPGFVGRGQSVVGLELAHGLGELEPLGQQMDEGGVDVVDAAAQLDEALLCAGRGIVVVVHRTSLTGR